MRSAPAPMPVPMPVPMPAITSCRYVDPQCHSYQRRARWRRYRQQMRIYLRRKRELPEV